MREGSSDPIVEVLAVLAVSFLVLLWMVVQDWRKRRRLEALRKFSAEDMDG